jgi:hypothetical protein
MQVCVEALLCKEIGCLSANGSRADDVDTHELSERKGIL